MATEWNVGTELNPGTKKKKEKKKSSEKTGKTHIKSVVELMILY